MIFKKRESSHCPLCQATVDDYEHFVVRCLPKAAIWGTILQEHSPSIQTAYNALHRQLAHLQLPPKLHRLQYDPCLSLCSTINFVIWKHYWNLYINDVLYSQPQITTGMMQRVGILQRQSIK